MTTDTVESKPLVVSDIAWSPPTGLLEATAFMFDVVEAAIMRRRDDDDDSN